MNYELAFWTVIVLCMTGVTLGGAAYLIDNWPVRWMRAVLDVCLVIGSIAFAPVAVVLVGLAVLVAAIKEARS